MRRKFLKSWLLTVLFVLFFPMLADDVSDPYFSPSPTNFTDGIMSNKAGQLASVYFNGKVVVAPLP